MAGHDPAGPVAVFDIGGTWFRCGVWTETGALIGRSKRSAANYHNTPHEHPAELQRALVDYLVCQVDSLRAIVPQLTTASVSLGAALNANTGEILQASPLWGPRSGTFPLRAALESARPGVRWLIVNDVTAALLRHVWAQRAALAEAKCPKVALFTISTGIACRTFDLGRWSVPVDRVHGVQGEVGHLPIDFRFNGVPIRSACDCGGLNHVNAFASGRGIERVARDVARTHAGEFAESALCAIVEGDIGRLGFAEVAEGVRRGDPLALRILDAACGPIADLVLQLLTYDPEVERVYIIGGAVDGLGDAYMKHLLQALDDRGMYQVSPKEPSFFRSRVVRGFGDDQSGLIGAGIFAQTAVAATAAATATATARPPTGARPGASRSVRADRRAEYRVEFVPGLLDVCNDALLRAARASKSDRRLVIIDDGASAHFGEAITRYFRHHDVEVEVCRVATCEKGKTLDTAVRIVDRFVRFGVLRRSEPVVAVGGGILTDLVGFAASIYRRGIPYVRVPTTLMGMVDAGIGVKTGVTFRGKNRLGTFYPPLHTLISLRFLTTLGSRYVRSGVAEIIKIALVRDGRLFGQVDRHLEALISDRFQTAAVGEDVVRSAVGAMLDELEPNLFEDELSRGVDFGHSFSPGLELASDFTLLHGEAVAVDMALSAVLSHRRGFIGRDVLATVLGLLRRAGLPLTHPTLRVEVLSAALTSTLEHRDGRQRVPLLAGVGSVRFVNDVTTAELQAAVAELNACCGEPPSHDKAATPSRRPDSAGPPLRVGPDAECWSA